MTYSKQIWTPNVTPVDAAHMSHIEDGIALAEILANKGVPGGYLGIDGAGNGNIPGGFNASGSLGFQHLGSGSGAVAFQTLNLPPDGYILVARQAADSSWRFLQDSQGRMNWGDGTALVANLYLAAGRLKTDGDFAAAGSIYAALGNNTAQILLGSNGTIYFGTAGDTILYRVAPGVLATGALATTAYGTALPAAPVDGQEFTLVDSVTNPSFQWRFRYNAASTSPHKWGFVGGAPALLRCPDFTPTGAGAWQMAAGSFSIPRAGHYIFEVTAQPNTVAASVQYHGIALDGSVLDPYCGVSLDAGYSACLKSRAQSDCSQGQTVQGACNSGYAVATFYSRDLSMLPVRVA